MDTQSDGWITTDAAGNQNWSLGRPEVGPGTSLRPATAVEADAMDTTDYPGSHTRQSWAVVARQSYLDAAHLPSD